MATAKVYITSPGDKLVIGRDGELMFDAGSKVTKQGTQAAAIADPAGGSTVDAECRAAVASMLATLRSLGIIAT